MISKQEKRNLYIYIGYLGILFGLFVYVNWIGWRIYNPDKVTHVEGAGRQSRGYHGTRFYHK